MFESVIVRYKRKRIDKQLADNTFAPTARIDHIPIHPRVSLRSALGYVLLRLQRALLKTGKNLAFAFCLC